MTMNLFFNYGFGGGWFVGTAQIVAANWNIGGRSGRCRSA